MIAAQETAGFEEGNKRVALGGLFNLLFFVSNLGKTDQNEPSGDLAELINTQHGNFEGFKDAFTKIVEQRMSPGWVWLSLTHDKKKLII